MTLLANYVYDIILNNILSYIYNNDYLNFNHLNYHHSIAPFYIISNNNEVIQYSLVCKKWFQLVSQILPGLVTHLNNDTLGFLMEKPSLPSPNQEVLEQLQKSQPDSAHHEKQNYKLIKLSDSTKTCRSIRDNDQELKSQVANSYKKLYVDVEYDETEEFLSNINNYPNNCEFKKFDSDSIKKIRSLEVSLCSIAETIPLLNIELRSLECYFNRYSAAKIEIEFFSSEFQTIQFPNLIKEPKDNSNENISPNLNNSNNNSITSNSNISSSSLSKLENLFFSFDIFKLFTGMMNINSTTTSDQIESQFGNIINQLSNDKTLKKLKIAHFCKAESCICKPGPLGFEMVYSGIKTIIAKSTSIQSFGISFANEKVNDSIIQSMIENKSIRNLILHGLNAATIIEKVLPFNRYIRNLTLTLNETDDINLILNSLNLLSKSSIDLYSLSLVFVYNHLNTVLESVCNLNISVKEISIDASTTDSTIVRSDFNEEYERTIFYKINHNHNSNIIINVFTLDYTPISK
ncbi:hypothetical protein DICPUDRAFT_84572 [Dictyostelium purpureum]|uniref:Uncharacterized protein n=1 Tax=Dictyostelium purpureum TaxID=5786 RepID=F1A326_DICPU|nr:uncharacterized protein DICPUDRAFT_84572 [Dictyostelium purpureum]EGC29398.1 hypothetical protein DICPUDRAFT_84572 [Dictyostelium purpureum]|eukprot:XP_003294069.1 hypothetical protein DICPUDRAFT_84572 [Dictyostelium purpureum]